jgi:HTH-type transcriptional regulator/antitoxin HipB
MSSMKDMTLHNAEQLGAAIRLKRREKRLTQSELAKLLGAERKWVLNLESGNSKAEIGLILRAIEVLGLRAFLTDKAAKAQSERGPHDLKTPRLDQVFQRLQRGPRK